MRQFIAVRSRTSSGSARKIAQHKRQNPTVTVIAELLLRIDSAQHLDVEGFAVAAGNTDAEHLPGLQRGKAGNGYGLATTVRP